MARTVALLVAALLLVPSAGHQAQAQTSPPDTLRGKVVSYASGSAFAVLDPAERLARIKLTGIDAPERRQRFAVEARNLASDWLGRRPIDITIDGRDAAGRIHGRVDVDGRDVGLVLIEAGLAWCDPGDEAMLPAATRDTYRAACDRARSSRLGLWQDANPSPPWDYRKLPEFEPPPGPRSDAAKSCREIGYRSVQCDDDTRYRTVGDGIVGSDGSIHVRRGNTVRSDDGTHYTRQGNSLYGSDGTVCRTRGRQTQCH